MGSALLIDYAGAQRLPTREPQCPCVDSQSIIAVMPTLTATNLQFHAGWPRSTSGGGA